MDQRHSPAVSAGADRRAHRSHVKHGGLEGARRELLRDRDESADSQAPQPPTGSGGARYQMLDVWRGVACLMVIAHHAGYALRWDDVGAASATEAGLQGACLWLLSRLSVGVPIFFVISGYCILASVESSRRKASAPWTFLSRRFWRIYPPYWMALLGFIAVVAALDSFGLGHLHSGAQAVKLDSPSALDLPRWIGNITLTETWRPHVWGPGRDVYTGVAWSLCYEEQFYFVCFLVLWLAPKRLYATLAAVSLAAIGLRVSAWQGGGLSRIAGTFPLLWHQFAAGLLVYYRLNLAQSLPRRIACDLGLVAMLTVGLCAGERETAVAAGFGLLLIALKRWDPWTDRLSCLAPLRACGRRCYSIYLAHLPVCVVGNLWFYELGLTSFWGRALVMIPAVSAVSLVVSWAFFDLVESYFLNPPAFRPGRREPMPLPLAGEAIGLQA